MLLKDTEGISDCSEVVCLDDDCLTDEKPGSHGCAKIGWRSRESKKRFL